MSHIQRVKTESVHALVRAGKIRALSDGSGWYEYYATPKAAEVLAGLGIDTQARRLPTDEQGNSYKCHVHQVVMEGKHGLLKQLGGINGVMKVMNGVHLIPLTDQVVNENVQRFEARVSLNGEPSAAAR